MTNANYGNVTFVSVVGPCLTTNDGQAAILYFEDHLVSSTGDLHRDGHIIPKSGPEVESEEACLRACLARHNHVPAVNFLKGKECSCFGGCPCLEPLSSDLGWRVGLPSGCGIPDQCAGGPNPPWRPNGSWSLCKTEVGAGNQTQNSVSTSTSSQAGLTDAVVGYYDWNGPVTVWSTVT